MSDTKGYTNLDYYAAHEIMMNGGDDRFYEKRLQIAIDAYEALNFSNSLSPKVAYLTLSAQNTVTLPNDYVNYILVGINSGGRIWTLTRNRNLVLPATESCGIWEKDNLTTSSNAIGQGANLNDGYLFSDHHYGEDLVSGAFAVGGGFNAAYYRIDVANRQIILLTQESYSGFTIILEYTSSGISANTIVPKLAKEAMMAYIDWKLALADKTMALNRILMLQSNWRVQKDLYYAMSHSFTIQEFLDEKYLSLSRGVKR